MKFRAACSLSVSYATTCSLAKRRLSVAPETKRLAFFVRRRLTASRRANKPLSGSHSLELTIWTKCRRANGHRGPNVRTEAACQARWFAVRQRHVLEAGLGRAGNTSTLPTGMPPGRFIPARSGNTRPAKFVPVTKPVHPRPCGERLSSAYSTSLSTGSSPRVRGTPGVAADRPEPCRFIPARAGYALL